MAARAVAVHLTFLLLWLSFAAPALADEDVLRRVDRGRSLRYTTIRFHYENDQTLEGIGSSDRWYTAGAGLEFTWQPCWADALAQRMPGACRFGPARTGAGLVLGGQLFTPEDIDTEALVEDDRPYAAYTWFGAFWQRSNDGILDHLQLDVGAIGDSLGAERLQRGVHDRFGYAEPEGWDNQLEDEPTLQAYARRKWRFEPTRRGRGLRLQAIPQAGIALGTVHRHLEGGLLVRTGFNLPDDFGPARLVDPGTATSVSGVRGPSAHVFGRASGRVVQHDLFLDGNTFADSHRVDKRPFVGEVSTGLELRYGFDGGGGVGALLFAFTWRSPEFEGQPEPHMFTTISIVVRWRH